MIMNGQELLVEIPIKIYRLVNGNMKIYAYIPLECGTCVDKTEIILDKDIEAYILHKYSDFILK